MRSFIADQEVFAASEFVELALGFEELPTGIDRELFIGAVDETAEERAARLDVAKEALNELKQRGADDEVSAWDAVYAEALMKTVPMLRSVDRMHRAFRKGDAA